MFNGRDRGPWRLSSPQLEALEERLGAVLLIQVGLIMPVHPLPPSLPLLHKIWEETRDKGHKGEEGSGGWLCVQPVAISAVELRGLERFPLCITPAVLPLWLQAFMLFHFLTAASFVEAALGLINTKTIC